MTVFVDDMFMPATVGRITSKWCHLFTDEDDQTELHALARKIGLQRSWFQHEHKYPDRPEFWHYDVTLSLRRKALAAGAVPISTMEGGRMAMARQDARKKTSWEIRDEIRDRIAAIIVDEEEAAAES